MVGGLTGINCFLHKMETKTFSMLVEEGDPLLIIIPYGNSMSEMMNMLIESLRRANVRNVYIDKWYDHLDNPDVDIYSGGSGIIFMSDVMDHYPYDPNMTPIYLVEWGVRKLNIKKYENWVNNNYSILYPSFVPSRAAPNIIPHEVKLSENNYRLSLEEPGILIYPLDNPTPGVNNILQNLDRYSPKIADFLNNVSAPCAIYTGGAEREHYFLQECFKHLNIPSIIIQRDSEFFGIAPLIRENNNRIIIITSNRCIFRKLPASVPIHILCLDSSLGLDMILGPHYHDNIHLYLNLGPNNESSQDSKQYSLLRDGINDISEVYRNLTTQSRNITSDRYNNLYIT